MASKGRRCKSRVNTKDGDGLPHADVRGAQHSEDREGRKTALALHSRLHQCAFVVLSSKPEEKHDRIAR